MKAIPVLFLLCWVKVIENIPMPANPITVQSYLNDVQTYKNGIPSASHIRVPTPPANTGHIVIKNPPVLPKTQTTTPTRAPVTTHTEIPSTTSITTKATTTTTSSTEVPTTTTIMLPSATTTCDTATTCESSSTSVEFSSTSVEFSSTSVEFSSTSVGFSSTNDGSSLTSDEPSSTSVECNELSVSNERYNEILSLLTELLKVTTSEQTRELIYQLIYKLTGETGTTTGSECTTFETEGQGKTTTDAEGDYIQVIEQLQQIIEKLDGEPTTAIKEVIELILQLITQLTEEDATCTTPTEEDAPSTTPTEKVGSSTSDDGTTNGENITEGEGNTNLLQNADENNPCSDQSDETATTDKISLLIEQLTILINEPITNTTCEQINQLILQLKSTIIEVDASNSGNNETDTVYVDETMETTEAEIKDLVKEIINLTNPPITTSTKEQLETLIDQLISLLLIFNDKCTNGTSSSNETSTSDENAIKRDEDTTNAGSDPSNTFTMTQPITAELPIDDCNTDTSGNERACADNATSAGSQISQLLAQLISLTDKPEPCIDELTNQLICQLIDILQQANATNGGDSQNSTTSNASIIDSEQIQELITQLQSLLIEPNTNTDSKYLNQVITELINELTGGQIGDTKSTGKGEHIKSEGKDANNTDDDVNTTTTVVTTTTTSIPCELISEPHGTNETNATKENVIADAIAEGETLSSEEDTTEKTNDVDNGPVRSINNREALMERRAHRKELAAQRSQKRKEDMLRRQNELKSRSRTTNY